MSADGALVLVTTSFPVHGDGREAAGAFVADLAEELALELPVRIVAPGPRSFQEEWARGVEVYRYRAPDVPLSTLRPWRPRDAVAVASVLASGKRAVARAVAGGPTKHILALWALPSGSWARAVSHATGIPYSVWTLGSDIWVLGRIPVIRGRLMRVLADADTCFSDGLLLADDTRRLGGRDVEFLASSRRLIAQRPELPRATPPYRLVFLGRWHVNKGVDVLMEALGRLNDEDWSRIEEVRIFGGGPLEPTVVSAATRLNAAGRPVHVGGYLDKAAVIQEISVADYLLIPSRVESIPVVFSDAMKLGCPVICSPVGDLPELVHQEGVGLCARAAGDSIAFAEVIREALRQSPRSFTAGLAPTAARFSLDTCIAPRIKLLSCP